MNTAAISSSRDSRNSENSRFSRWRAGSGGSSAADAAGGGWRDSTVWQVTVPAASSPTPSSASVSQRQSTTPGAASSPISVPAMKMRVTPPAASSRILMDEAALMRSGGTRSRMSAWPGPLAMFRFICTNTHTPNSVQKSGAIRTPARQAQTQKMPQMR